MHHFLKHYLYLFYFTILMVYVFNIFAGIEILTYLIGAAAIPMLLLSFPGASRLFKILGSLFILAGVVLFLQSGRPALDFLEFMTTNMGLIALLMMLPWMNSVVRSGRFDRRINELMKTNVSNLGQLYGKATLTSYTLISFINLSALPLTQGVLKENLSNLSVNLRNKFISQTTLRAFSMALVWSPMEIMVAISVDATGVSYLVYLPWLLLFSVIMVSLDIVWGKIAYSKLPYEPVYHHEPRSLSIKQVVGKIIHLFLALAVFLTAVIIVSNLFELNFILAVTLVIFPFAALWALSMKRWYSFVSIGWHTWKARTNGMQNFVVLFVSLALFSNSLSATPLLQVIQDPFIAASDRPLVILFFIQLSYLLMSMIGVHPIATIGVLMEVITPLYDVINPLSLGIVLITGAMATASAATYGVTVTLTSMYTHQNPYRITIANLPFAIIYGTVGTLIAFFLA
ncbi:hypothetical protein MM300_22060 [Evansella sp. LMS18]|uniref:hypothetical protein n=1 Tax=Evansella sp. LMS18 TaxID=2924033 RepID=UPI0020D062C4|nr:hypothetical protein [Evansella sp. LMS18]UTR10519.1 hypothetical protein MM300_22060 [Evansella sp. LMS18]